MSVVSELLRDAEVADHVLALLRWARRTYADAHTLHLYANGVRFEEKDMLTLRDNEKFAASVEARSAAGNLTSVEAPVWSVSDPSKLEMTVDTVDPMKVSVRAIGPLGSAQVRFDCDGDLGEGVRPLFGVLDVDIVAGDADTITVVAGTPENQ